MTTRDNAYERNELGQINIKKTRSQHRNSLIRQPSPWSTSSGIRMQHIGFRRLARAYLLGSSRHFDRNGKYASFKVMASQNGRFPGRSQEQNNRQWDYSMNPTFNFPSHLYPNINIYNPTQKETRVIRQNNYPIENTPFPDDVYSPYKKARIPFFGAGYKSSTSLPLPYSTPESNPTEIIISNIPEFTGVDSVLAQVRGGQLSRVSVPVSKYSSSPLKFIVVTFCNPQDAKAFLEYGNTNLFKVNGMNVDVNWYFDEFKSPYNAWSGSVSTGNSQNSKTTRCLILKKNEKKRIITKHGVVVENGVIPFDETTIEEDFSIFGNIQGITPVISRKLCISIHFMDILSAMRAMHSFRQHNSDIYKKYHNTWSMWYGVDVTARPCIA